MDLLDDMLIEKGIGGHMLDEAASDKYWVHMPDLELKLEIRLR